MTIFSGVQPSGNVTIGNYFGALKNWVALQHHNHGDCFYSVVDLHSVTVRQEPNALRDATLDAFALCVAMGVNADDNTLFVQSHVPQHTELWWALNQFVPFGELSRMTQFKDKARGGEPDEVMAGLFNYPVLMAADILLYRANLVAVGDDQGQHLQLARHIVKKVNNHLSGVDGSCRFPPPLVHKSKAGGRIMALQEPTKKMSKSDPNPSNSIGLLDTPDVIHSKVWSASTNLSLNGIVSDDPTDHGLENLKSIGRSLWGGDVNLNGISVRALKSDLSQGLVAELSPIRDRFNILRDNEVELNRLMRLGAEKAEEVAAVNLARFKGDLGLVSSVS